MARILLGVTGGVAAYKALELVRLADRAGHSLRVVQTPASTRFVARASFEALTGAPVLVHELERDPARGSFPDQSPPAHTPPSHLQLAANADLYVIAPASANTIAKLAHGLADNLLCSAALACRCPLLVAPAMNNQMYEHPATQANLRTLRERGVSIVGPASGKLASRGEHGIGRLVEPAELLEACERLLAGGAAGAPDGSAPGAPGAGVPSGRPGAGAGPAGAGHGAGWEGLRVLISAGGTREPIDAVRFVGNRSSGRMGLALAAAAHARGAQVTVVAANVSLEPPAGVRWLPVHTAAELQRACEQELDGCDVLLMAAAVADYRPRSAAPGKLKKEGRERLQLELERTADVLSALSERRHAGQTLVGFAAEHGREAMAGARRKLVEKRLDALIANDVSLAGAGFEAPENEVVILTERDEQHVSRAPKAQIAEEILDAVGRVRAGAGATVEGDAGQSRGQRLRALPARQ